MKAPTPANETDRLKALGLYQQIDDVTTRTLNNLTQLAASICETPISVITMVEEQRQCFVAQVGIEGSETSRDEAFCAHALDIDDLLIVEDAQKDPRFSDNPFVTNDPLIRFYAGAPLTISSNLTLGTLCVIDREPRQLSENQKNALRILRDTVVAQLELSRARQDLKELQSLLPMCAWCRSIQTEDGSWRPLHEYVADQQKVTHGICPVCSNNLAGG